MPSPKPRVPARPRREPRLDGQARCRFGGAFQGSGENYDAVRPRYPNEAIDFALSDLDPATAQLVDLGAGTGLFTTGLVNCGSTVTAVDPSVTMLATLRDRLPMVNTVEAKAESTGLPEASFDAAVCAQAWHWVDPVIGSREAARILRPGGTLTVVWNQLDTSIDWIHRLTRIMHSGDVHAAEQHRPRLRAPFGPEEHLRVEWRQPITVGDLHGLMASRSYWLRHGESVRQKMTGNLDWYLYEHLGVNAAEQIELPYITIAWRAVRSW